MSFHKILIFWSLEAIPTADEKEAFMDIDAALMVGAFPRKQGMERKDLLQRNAKIFESQGKSLDQYAKKSVKVIWLHLFDTQLSLINCHSLIKELIRLN